MNPSAPKTHPISLAEIVTAQSMQPYRPTFARVDSASLAHNFEAFRKLAGNAKIMAVMKADAYGHGLLKCARIFSDLGAAAFGVAFVEEGIALRRAGFTEPVLVLGGIVGTQIALFLDYDLDMTASSVFKIEAINEAAKGTGKRGRVHIKIDTGMNRIGQNWRTVDELFAAVHRCEHVELVGMYSHLATAEDPDTTFARLQIQRFEEALKKARAAGLNPGIRHLVNSAGAIQFPEAHYDMIRPGLGLYGQYPSPDLASRLPLKSAMSLVSEIVYMKRVRKGEGVSYGLKWHAPEDVWVATVPVGYGDGYPRLLSGSPVLIGGKRYPIIGAVCMDQLMVNLGQDRTRVGTEVVMWGRQGDDEITLWELCKPSGFIPYELPIYLTGRVPRVFV